eukprot:scaffold6226_cov118-Cylindrotheca_fusiformis.AAC.1
MSDDGFAPMVVSFKSRSSVTARNAARELDEMEEMAKAAKWECGLCLLVLVGLDEEADSNAKDPRRLSPNDASELVDTGGKGRIVTKTLYVPDGDSFGISDQFKDLTKTVPMSEILASQSFLHAHTNSMKSMDGKRDFLDSCIHKGNKNSVREMAWSIADIEAGEAQT